MNIGWPLRLGVFDLSSFSFRSCFVIKMIIPIIQKIK
jgi:hypothetical protein